MASLFDRIKSLFGSSPSQPQASTGYGGMGTSQFESAKLSRRRGHMWTPAPQDFRKEMLVGDRLEMIRRSRYLEKNSGFYREYIKSMALYSVGSGIWPQLNTQDSQYNEEGEGYLRDWYEVCEITGRFDFLEITTLVCKAIDRDGECFILLVRDEEDRAVMQMVESHRVGNATANVDGLNDGILFDQYGRVVSYRVIEDDGSFVDVPAESVLHVYDPESVTGSRGYPPLQHAINHIYDEMELLAMEKQAIKDQSEITRVFRKANPNEDASDFPELGHADYDENVKKFERNFGGKSMVVDEGEALEHLESKRPNSTFTGFLEHLRRDSSQGGMQYEFIADPSKIGGASVRLVVAKQDRNFQHRQNVLISRFLKPAIRWVLADAIDRGELRDMEDWHKLTFTTPCRVTVDAGRMADHERADIEFGLGTLTDSYAARGMDAREEIVRKAKELKMINEVAAEYGLDPTSLYKLAAGIQETLRKPNQTLDQSTDNSRNVQVGPSGAGGPPPPQGETDAEDEEEGEEAEEEGEEAEGESPEQEAEEEEPTQEEGEEAEVDEDEEEDEDEAEDEQTPKPRRRK